MYKHKGLLKMLMNHHKDTKDQNIELLPRPLHNPYFNPFVYIWIVDKSGMPLIRHEFLDIPFRKQELFSGMLVALRMMTKDVFNADSNLIKFELDNFLLNCKITRYFSVITLSFKQYSTDWYVPEILRFISRKFRQQYKDMIHKEDFFYDTANFSKFHQVIDRYFDPPRPETVKKVYTENKGSLTRIISKLLKFPIIAKH